MSTDRCRKWQITINNPLAHGYTHEKIKEIVFSNAFEYVCFCDEVGKESTPHTHIYIYFSNAVTFDVIKKRFPEAHIEIARGSSQQNRDYIRKEGIYADSEKKETNIIDSFEEYGDLPLDKSERGLKQSDEILQMIKAGCSNTEILDRFPSCYKSVNHIEQTRQSYLAEKFSSVRREIQVTYIYGKTRTGKTRYVMDRYGYEKVYKVNDYRNPFDRYDSQDVILFDEFRDSIQLTDMLQFLDCYPLQLPARYGNKTACFTKVYIISNHCLNEQFATIQKTHPDDWNAFISRIHKIYRFERNNNIDSVSPVIIEENPETYRR